MKGSEFLRKLQDRARQSGTKITFTPQRGKGSYGTLYYGEKRTTLRNVKDKLKTGTLHAMLKQLGIDPKSFQVWTSRIAMRETTYVSKERGA